MFVKSLNGKCQMNRRLLGLFIFLAILTNDLLLAKSVNFEGIYAPALRGEITKTLKMLDSMPDAELTKKQLEIKQKYYKRFREQGGKVSIKTEDPFVRFIIETFQTHWANVFLGKSSLEDAEKVLWDSLTDYLLKNNLVDPNETWEVVRDEPDKYIKKILRSKGYYGIMGRTWPYHDLLIWQKETEKEYLIELPDGPRKVKVVFLDDFIIRGWMEYVTFGRNKSGGWAKKEALYCPVHYDLSSPGFKIRFLVHEGQHLADYNLFPEPILGAADFEYRAKLAQLSLGKEDVYGYIKAFIEGERYDKTYPHPFANHCIIRDLSKRLFGEEFVTDIEKWKKVPYDKINEASAELLKKSTKLLRQKRKEFNSSNPKAVLEVLK